MVERRPNVVPVDRSSGKAWRVAAALAVALVLAAWVLRLRPRQPAPIEPVRVALGETPPPERGRSSSRRDGTSLVEGDETLAPDLVAARAPRPPEVGPVAGGAAQEGIGARIAAALRAARAAPTPAPAGEAPAGRKLKAAQAPDAGGSRGGGGVFPAAAAAAGPGAAPAAGAKAAAPGATVGPPPGFDLAKWTAGVNRYLASGKPAPGGGTPRARGGGPAAGPGGGAAPPITGAGAPATAGGPTLPRIPDPEAPDANATLKRPGRGSIRNPGPAASRPGACPPGQVARSAPTRSDPGRTFCDTPPSTNGKGDRARIHSVLERIQRILRVMRSSVMHPGIAALKQLAEWCAADVDKARPPMARLQAETEQTLAFFEAQAGPEAGRAAEILRELRDWIAEEEGPVNGLARVAGRLAAASACLQGDELNALAACHAEAVTPGLGRGLHNQAGEVEYLKRALREDPDLIEAAGDLEALAKEDPSRRGLFDRLVAYVNSAQGHADAAARHMRNATSGWDDLKDGQTLGSGFADAAAAQKAAFDLALAELSESGAYAEPGGMAVWSDALATQTALGDSAAGWRQSTARTRADGSRAKPVERIEGAVDGSQGAVGSLLAGVRLLEGLTAILAGLK